MGETFYVSTDAYGAVMAVEEAVMKDAQEYGTKIADEYTISTPAGACFTKIYEKYSELINEWLLLFIVSDNFEGKTKVHIVCAGGREALLGPSIEKNIMKLARRALEQYIEE